MIELQKILSVVKTFCLWYLKKEKRTGKYCHLVLNTADNSSLKMTSKDFVKIIAVGNPGIHELNLTLRRFSKLGKNYSSHQ